MIHQAEIIDKQGEMGTMWGPPSYKLNSLYISIGVLIYSTIYHNMITWYSFNGGRRKFRSQTSDNMERWKAEQGRGIEKRKIRRKKSGCGASWPQERWKIARRCGAKHIWKSKVLKTGGLGALLEVEMSKKCTALWREAHFEVKMYKTLGVRTTFGSWDVKKCTPLWCEAHFEVKMYKTLGVRTTFGS